ncbi:MAG: signal peptide peptidase SppA [Rhodocyclaceae bacterium]|nr:signal peptide peptidase SppA [Rhodocyclaceae bacterium]MCA3031634.1 signal peptide peptidase SppA [Rhodocyclaceae bacterium]MCA3038281.1 signal peptide peptidase SppA [Rhodocyclaceae bacterium]MCA3047011.1 signal peptide peptidase SppA [Rhodocyclaceae bacterium]MCA3049042.1 signal peptide peptidase SppA [Rhodocyclaceae bacterium]
MENPTVPAKPAEIDNSPAALAPPQTSWERSVLETLAMETLAEQKRTRRWRTIVSMLWLSFFVLILLLVLGATAGKQAASGLEKHTALVDLKGVIAAESKASADKIISALQSAFKDKNTQGVVLRIDSPGGSPVQSGYINDEIKRLRALHKDIPLYVVVQDICASGGYYVAVAADKIFVNKASIVGSVGVLMDGFGFTGTMDKLGVERRLVAAGSNKGFLDPFSPVDPEQQKFAQQMVNEIHEQFIKVVREGRGKRLKETPEMFSGLVWSGEKSVALGLADGIGGLDYVAREVIKAETIIDYTPEDSLSEQFARRIGASVGASASDALWQSIVTKLLSERATPTVR